MPNVATAIAEQLKQLGVDRIFTIPGKSVVPLLLAFDEMNLPVTLARHETGAGYMATGYALMKQSIAVCVTTSGPGATNALTAAGQAKAYHLPVLFITGHPSSGQTGSALGQDSSAFGTNTVEMFKHVTVYSDRVDRQDQLATKLTHCVEAMLSRTKGPAHLSIPYDVLLEPLQTPLSLQFVFDQTVAPSNVLYDALSMISQAPRKALLVGKGANSLALRPYIQSLCEQYKIYAVSTPGGKSIFPTDHPYYLGGFGLGGTDDASQFFANGCDCLIVMGTKLSDMSLAGMTEAMFPSSVIHFDYDRKFIGKSLPVPTLFVPGDLFLNVTALHEIAEREVVW